MCANDINRIVGETGRAVGTVGGAANNLLTGSGRVFGDLGKGNIGKAGTDLQNTFIGEGPASPAAPEIDPGLTGIKNQQMENARQFRSNLPSLKNQMAQDLAGESNKGMYGQLGAAKESQNRRGLLYGGVAQGQNAGIRGAASSNLAGAITKANTGLESAADTLDAQAIDTAYGIQQNQQAIQDAVYSQAMARLNGQNSMIGNMASTAAMAAFL